VDHGPVPVQLPVNTHARTGRVAQHRNPRRNLRSRRVCDDDDRWLPGKLTRQVAELHAEPGAVFATTSIVVEFGDSRSPRTAGRSRVFHADLLPSQMAMLHSSTFLAARGALLDGIGQVAEDAPGGQNEDWDLLLRASRRQPIVHCDELLVAVRWGRASVFATQWETKIASREWMLDRHPDLRSSAVGLARVYGQIAFAHAALGRRGPALRSAWRSARIRPAEPRGYLATNVLPTTSRPSARRKAVTTSRSATVSRRGRRVAHVTQDLFRRYRCIGSGVGWSRTVTPRSSADGLPTGLWAVEAAESNPRNVATGCDRPRAWIGEAMPSGRGRCSSLRG
jgi:hypothetical protein